MTPKDIALSAITGTRHSIGSPTHQLIERAAHQGYRAAIEEAARVADGADNIEGDVIAKAIRSLTPSEAEKE